MLSFEKIHNHLERLKYLKGEIEIYGNPQMFIVYNSTYDKCEAMVIQRLNIHDSFQLLLQLCDILHNIIIILNDNMKDHTSSDPNSHTPSYTYKLYNDVARKLDVLIKEIKSESK